MSERTIPQREHLSRRWRGYTLPGFLWAKRNQGCNRQTRRQYVLFADRVGSILMVDHAPSKNVHEDASRVDSGKEDKMYGSVGHAMVSAVRSFYQTARSELHRWTLLGRIGTGGRNGFSEGYRCIFIRGSAIPRKSQSCHSSKCVGGHRQRGGRCAHP